VILKRTPAGRVAVILLALEVAQGTIGFVQYLTDLPIALVAAHLVGAAALIAGGTRLLVIVVAPSSPAQGTAAASPQTQSRRSR
jgi:cytochrome c oxidase assembly protein subunit 15